MVAPRKFATLAADALRRSVSPEMERAAEVQLREVVRRVWWVLQPYRSFGESRVTIRRTEDTMKYIRGLPADSTQRAAATAMRVERRRLSIRPHGLGDGADGGRAVISRHPDFS